MDLSKGAERAACPECGARRGHLLGCPHGDPKLAGELAQRATVQAAGPALDVHEDARWETQVRRWAVPGALLATLVLSLVWPGKMALKLFAGMWFHELGHASVAWGCGYWAVPVPWFTYVSGERSWLLTLLLVGGLLYGAFALHRRGSPRAGVAAAVVLVAVLIGRLGFSHRTAQIAIVFGGEAGALVLGAAAMAAFYSRRLKAGALRWGVLGLGAGSYMDSLRKWLAVRRDWAELDFGSENGTLSDTSKLVDLYGWTEQQVLNRHLLLAAACAVAVALVYARGLKRQPD